MTTPTNDTTGTGAATDQLPLKPGLWLVDSNHSSVTFAIRHLGLAKVRGRFNVFDARLEVGPTLADTRLEATVQMASIDTSNTDRDAHVRSADFLDVERFPEMRFVSTQIGGSNESWRVDGHATVKGETRPFSLDVEFGGIADFMENRHAGFSASGQLRRKDFGLTFGPMADAGLGNVISFDLDVELVEPR
ncbi:MAG: YceI family protein [Acidimicrobiales bacterium]